MDPGYETIIETKNLIWTMAVYLLHGGIVFFQTSLAFFLLATGAHNLLAPDLDRGWLRRLGTIVPGGPRTRLSAGIRIVFGLLMLAPIAIGAPAGMSLAGTIGALALLIVLERQILDADRLRGRFIRRTAIAFAAISSLFILWEGEDNLVLGADLLIHSMEWRDEEVAWQNSLDPKSPKVGDLAPDFELQDPEGNVRVRLSDFRGRRPVALVFGSYT
jgi:hypothetical protein